MRNRAWTPADESALRLAAEEGATLAEVAEELGRTRRAARHRAAALHVRFMRGRPDAGRRSLVLGLLGCGLTLREIARRTGVGFNAVRVMVGRLIRAGLVRRTGTHNFDTRYVVTRRFLNGDG